MRRFAQQQAELLAVFYWSVWEPLLAEGTHTGTRRCFYRGNKNNNPFRSW